MQRKQLTMENPNLSEMDKEQIELNEFYAPTVETLQAELDQAKRNHLKDIDQVLKMYNMLSYEPLCIDSNHLLQGHTKVLRAVKSYLQKDPHETVMSFIANCKESEATNV